MTTVRARQNKTALSHRSIALYSLSSTAHSQYWLRHSHSSWRFIVRRASSVKSRPTAKPFAVVPLRDLSHQSTPDHPQARRTTDDDSAAATVDSGRPVVLQDSLIEWNKQVSKWIVERQSLEWGLVEGRYRLKGKGIIFVIQRYRKRMKFSSMTGYEFQVLGLKLDMNDQSFNKFS